MFYGMGVGVWASAVHGTEQRILCDKFMRSFSHSGKWLWGLSGGNFLSSRGGPEMCEVALRHHPTARRFKGHVRQAIIVFPPDMYVNRSHSSALAG